MEPNAIYCGDCLDVLKKFPDKSVDLIYADPPFYTNRRFEIIWKDGAEIRAFGDRWQGGINHYISWMIERLEQCFRILKNGGSLYLHCDWHASHYLKVATDRIFGGENSFVNEIVWRRQTAHSDAKQGSKHFGRLHDVILFYVKSGEGKTQTWNNLYSPYNESYISSFYRHRDPKTGRIFALDNLVGPGGAAKGNPYYEFMGVKRYWRYSEDKMKQLLKEGRIYQSKPGTVPRYKRYLDEMPGVPIQDVWIDISVIQSQSKEALGYPTQKPIALLERIISASSNKGQIVLDPFCGCGTTLVASQKLSRKWIGIDVSRTACKLMERRLRSLGASPMMIYGELTEKELKKYPPFEFQNWVCEKLGGRISERKSGDMGIDGWTLDMTPIQVKQSDDIGRNPIDNFRAAIQRRSKKRGIFVAFSFGKGAIEEVARLKNQEGIEIELKTVKELLEGKK